MMEGLEFEVMVSAVLPGGAAWEQSVRCNSLFSLSTLRAAIARQLGVSAERVRLWAHKSSEGIDELLDLQCVPQQAGLRSGSRVTAIPIG